MGAQDSALARPVYRISNFLNHGEGNEGHEGDEEEGREQDCQGHHVQGNGAPREQGEDRRWLDGKGPDAEQVWQDRKQKAECFVQAEVQADVGAMEPGCGKGAQSLEDYRLLFGQEGHTLVLESQGALQPVSAALT